MVNPPFALRFNNRHNITWKWPIKQKSNPLQCYSTLRCIDSTIFLVIVNANLREIYGGSGSSMGAN
jgi:hypothetical protein